MSLKEVTIPNMWEIAALGKCLNGCAESLRWGGEWRRGRRADKEEGSMSWLRKEFGTGSGYIKNEGGEISV
jgi:hypothetical protein